MRTVLVASEDDIFCGYVTVKRYSDHLPFRQASIPEIADLNVLKFKQGIGIGKKLLQAAEKLIFVEHPVAGMDVGLHADYVVAQRLYISLGYKPDGCGVTYQNHPCAYGEKVLIDDDLVLWMTKSR